MGTDSSDELIGGLLKRLGSAPVEGPLDMRRCSEMQPGEAECVDGWHMAERPGPGIVGEEPRAVKQCLRRCPHVVRQEIKERVRAEREALRGELERCGYKQLTATDHRPVSRVLREVLDEARTVNGLPALLAMLDTFMVKPIDRNVILRGPVGTGKTTAQLCLHFACLERGIGSRYVTSTDLRRIAVNRQSANDDLQVTADRELAKLKAAQVLAWSDIGSERGKARNLAETLQDLFDGLRGVCVGSTNRTSEQIAADEDNYGPRIASRLFADRDDRRAVVIHLEGSDQRRHAADRKQRDVRARAAGDR